MANRSRHENKELEYTIRVNGRIYAAFRSFQPAEDMAYALGGEYDVDLTERDGVSLLHLRPSK